MAKKSKVDIPAAYIRNSIVLLFFLIIGLWLYRSTAQFLQTAPVFRVKEVSVGPDVQFVQSKVLMQVRGRNIFAIDLKRLHNEIRALYPQIYDLHVERRFPDTIFVDAKRRDAFAQILVKQNYLTIDGNGSVMFADKNPAPQLPLIKNAKLEKFRILLGSKLATPQIDAGIAVIRAFQGNAGLSKYPISNVDVENISKISFFIGSELQIILDQDNIQQNLETLSFLFAQKKLNFREIKYIDLRFKEPVVGKK